MDKFFRKGAVGSPLKKRWREKKQGERQTEEEEYKKDEDKEEEDGEKEEGEGEGEEADEGGERETVDPNLSSDDYNPFILPSI